MNHQLKGRKLIHGDIISPEVVIAEFSEDFDPVMRKQLVATLNYGHDMILAYATYRQHLSMQSELRDTVDLIDLLEDIFRRWDYDMFAARRRGEQG